MSMPCPDWIVRLRDFLESQASSCSMDPGCVTLEYVWRMWGEARCRGVALGCLVPGGSVPDGAVTLTEIAAALPAAREGLWCS